MMNPNQRDTLVSCLAQAVGPVEDSFVDTLVPLLRLIELPGGKMLFQEGDPSDGVYFVISGRLQACVNDEGRQKPLGEVARGEALGEIGILTGEPRRATVSALRDSVLAYLSREVFEQLWRRQPEVLLQISRVVIDRLKQSDRPQKVKRPATVCLLAVTEGVDLRRLGEDLVAELDRFGVAAMETSASIDARFGAGAAETTDREAELHQKVTMWLDDVEYWNEYVLLAADGGDTEWTRRCLRQADEVMLVARAEAPVELHPIEEALCMGEGALTATRQALLLLHEEGTARPSGTRAWLDRRPVDTHYHVRPSHPRDMARLARTLSGNAIGLVLGGGGARGFAHLGLLRALEELDTPIDMIGGTSIGATIALWPAQGYSAAEALEIVDRGFRSLLDYTPPIASLLAGRSISRTIERHAAAWDIEDL